ncbi:MAG TPA: hypothetical protein VKG68_01490, partial [Candidatus Binatus sp.]|nr:hypothetical protein [Candidatus Binatus sp.]
LSPVNRSESLNLSPESANLSAESPSPPPDESLSNEGVGQRESDDESLAEEPARESKSPPPDGVSAPARSSKLPPTPLAPQVLEPPPLEIAPLLLSTDVDSAVPIELAPELVPAVTPEYSPIVCALARDTHSASAAVNANADGTISFASFMGVGPPLSLLPVLLDT